MKEEAERVSYGQYRKWIFEHTAAIHAFEQARDVVAELGIRGGEIDDLEYREEVGFGEELARKRTRDHGDLSISLELRPKTDPLEEGPSTTVEFRLASFRRKGEKEELQWQVRLVHEGGNWSLFYEQSDAVVAPSIATSLELSRENPSKKFAFASAAAMTVRRFVEFYKEEEEVVAEE